ncbi:MAG: isoleucine--tRNA ligase, partial [Sphingomicrobium sp.]
EEQYRKKKLDKDQVPIKEFRAECRAYAQHWVDAQREQLKRLGIGGQWDKPYLTMNSVAEGTIVSELLKFAESGQLYRGAKPVMWSPVEKTALAEAEIEYEDIVSTQIDVAFEIVESPLQAVRNASALIWTTTPWTITVNQAIAYGPEIEYAVCRIGDRMGDHERPVPKSAVVVAAGLIDTIAGRLGFRLIPLETFKGSDLAGTIARHPMHHLGDFFAKPRPFLPGDFVTTETGTGLVHMAPDHGEDDFDLCKANGIDPVFAVEGDGKYRADWAWLGGQGSVINGKFNAPDGPICNDLRASGGLLAASADYKHSYPHSWRSKAKVIYRCTPQWFIGMDRPLAPLPAREGNRERALSRWENEGGHLAEGRTLRETALKAITDTRWVPEKGENRIRSMVEGRPDWVISRQRAWGVPIALFVKRGGNHPLVDDAVNARIVAAIKAEGVDAWEEARAQEYLGEAYQAADYEMVSDILDVWFDSGCTHVFTLESGAWPEQRWPADLYLEGSDQHRGWFQSSLMESCGTRGRAPYNAVLTHGFTMDSKGMKMSKSLGNTISPTDLMRDSGADILRLWALSVDFTEDHRIGKEILAGVADQYRKLRNTFRYLLGALEGFDEAERVTDAAAMPELERYMLDKLFRLDVVIHSAIKNYDFNEYVRELADFCNDTLSAFYFDIRKDCLYCDAPSDPTRRAYRTVLDILFDRLIRYAAPVLVFTAEEVWQTRNPNGTSVHLLELDEAPNAWMDGDLAFAWDSLRILRTTVTEAIEPLRRDKVVGSSLQVEVALPEANLSTDLAELFITGPVRLGDTLTVTKTDLNKCGRCWRHLPEVTEDGDLCDRCEGVVRG